MNCLLIMPSTRDNEGDYCTYYEFPLGICYIAAAMKKLTGINTITLNMNQIKLEQTSENRRKIIREMIRDNSIDVVLTGGLCTLYPRIREIVETVKELDEKIVTVVGGGIVSGDPETAMLALEFADYGVIGEGEVTVAELCQTLSHKQPVDEVKGIILKKQGQWISTGRREEVADLQMLPWCDYDAFGFDEYLNQNANSSFESNRGWLPKPGLTMLTSRSCPHKCTFCFHPEGGRYRQRNLDDFFAELEHLIETHQIDNVSLVDEMIGSTKAGLEEFCHRIKKYNIYWTTSIRVSDITEKSVKLLKDSNCRGVCMGLESASDKILKSMKKGITVAQIENALKICREQRFYASGNFILGDPQETLETCMETLEWYLAHPLYCIDIGVIWYYPGSEIYWNAVSEGKIPDRVQHLRSGFMTINNTKMTDAEFNKIVNETILDYQTRRYKLLPELAKATISVKDTRITLKGKCGNCGSEQKFINLSPYAVNFPLICSSCATPLSSSALANNQLVKKNLEFLVDKYGEVAFWGIGARFKMIMNPAYMENPHVHLVDRKSGGTFGNKPIEPLDAIAENKVSVVIAPPRTSWGWAPGTYLSVPDLFGEISAEARSKYGVPKVLDLFDLWFRDLQQFITDRPAQ